MLAFLGNVAIVKYVYHRMKDPSPAHERILMHARLVPDWFPAGAMGIQVPGTVGMEAAEGEKSY